LKEETSLARRRLVRDAVIYTPICVAVLVAWVVVLAGVVRQGGGGSIFLLLLLTLVALLVGFRSVQSLRDLRSTPLTSEGEVRRKWRRAELLLFPAYYLYLNRNVFKIPPLAYHQVQPGDFVALQHYPHTSTVVSVTRLRRGEMKPGE
jgi:hypothetical protein